MRKKNSYQSNFCFRLVIYFVKIFVVDDIFPFPFFFCVPFNWLCHMCTFEIDFMVVTAPKHHTDDYEWQNDFITQLNQCCTNISNIGYFDRSEQIFETEWHMNVSFFGLSFLIVLWNVRIDQAHTNVDEWIWCEPVPRPLTTDERKRHNQKPNKSIQFAGYRVESLPNACGADIARHTNKWALFHHFTFNIILRMQHQLQYINRSISEPV